MTVLVDWFYLVDTNGLIYRMIMLGLKMVGEIPFHEVYCHSLVRGKKHLCSGIQYDVNLLTIPADSDGRKMSKSLGEWLLLPLSL